MSLPDPSGLAIGALHVLRPLWLLGLCALPLLAWAWRARARRQSVWRDAVDPHLLPHLLEVGSAARGRAGPWPTLIGLALALLALSGPSWRQLEQPLWQTRAPLVIALDLSSAIQANDLPPSRLLQARAKIASLLAHRKGGQVGLVAYADDAYTVSPLTDDAANVALFLDALEPDVMPAEGSRADRAIARSARLLKQAGFERGDILLLASDAGERARAAAARAAQQGYRVSTLGLGTASGAAYRKPDGGIGQSHLDAATLQAIASAGGGAYTALAADDSDLGALGVLDPAQARALSARGGKGATWVDDGYWLLPPLLLLAALAFRRGGALAMLLLCLALPLAPAHAAQGAAAGKTAAPSRAGAADPTKQSGTLWRRVDQQAYRRAERGQQAYRKRDFAAASQAYTGIPSADGAYNLGNALAQQGRYEEAISAYDNALARQPGMADAIANRKAVQAAMKRKPPKGGDKNKPNPDDKQSGQSRSQSGQQGNPGKGKDDPQRGKPPPQQGKQDSQGQGQQPTPEQPPPRTPGQQRAADAAQRERMQKALQQQRQANSGQDVAGKPDRARQAAQRERSLANDAWLRRVPDDPGALLRAKFQLEYERRQAEGGE